MNPEKNPVNDSTEHTTPDRGRHAADLDDRTDLEKRLAEARASIQARIKRIEGEVGSGPKAIWAGARKRPVASLLAVAAAGLLFGRLIFRKRRRPARMVDPPAATPGPGGGGMRYLFWITLLQTGLGLFADAAADFFAKRSGGAQRIFREKQREANRKEGWETRDMPPKAEDHSPSS